MGKGNESWGWVDIWQDGEDRKVAKGRKRTRVLIVGVTPRQVIMRLMPVMIQPAATSILVQTLARTIATCCLHSFTILSQLELRISYGKIKVSASTTLLNLKISTFLTLTNLQLLDKTLDALNTQHLHTYAGGMFHTHLNLFLYR